jgi:ribosomal protein L16 Arg81 hydroxylase
MSIETLRSTLLEPVLAGHWDHPFVSLVRRGVAPPIAEWTAPTSRPGARRPSPRPLVRLMREGFTLKIQNVELGVSAVREVVVELERRTARYVSAVFFMTPVAEVGLNPHHDDTDVVVEQVQGSKRWQVWTPVTSPRTNCGLDQSPTGIRHEVVLVPGEMLYIPRGWTHCAEAVGDQPSVHLSYCLRTSHSWRDLATSVQSPS